MRGIPNLLAASWLLAVLAADGAAQQRRDGNLKIGDAAADFTLKDMDGKTAVKLSGLKGRPVVLIFGSCT